MAQTTETTPKGAGTSVSDVRRAVETANAEDENSRQTDDDGEDQDDEEEDEGEGDSDDTEDSDENDSDDTDDSDEEEDDEDDENVDDKSPKTKRKYQQYVGDGSDKSYISNLEKALQTNTSETVSQQTKLNQATARVDAIMQAAANDPALAKRLNEAMNGKTGDGNGTGSSDSKTNAAVNPFVSSLQKEWEEKSDQEIAEFIQANPEVESDPKIRQDVQHYIKLFSNDYFERTGKLMAGGEAMAAAYKHLGLENKLTKQNLAAGAKKSAAPTRTRGKVKKATSKKQSFTSDQIAMAKAMGKGEDWLTKNATK